MDQLRTRLRQAQLLATPNRLVVLSILAGDARPTTVASIYLALQQCNHRRSLGTVYRTVGELLRHGLVQREWDGLGNSLYALVTSTQSGHGLEMVCRHSRERRSLTDPALVARLMKLARECGLDIVPEGIVIEVTCAPTPESQH